MVKIKEGTLVRIKRGTTVYPSGGRYAGKPATRDQTVRVSVIRPPYDYNVESLIGATGLIYDKRFNPEKPIPESTPDIVLRYLADVERGHQYPPRQSLYEQYRVELEATIGDLTVVEWTNKWALLRDVEAVEDTKSVQPKAAGKRERMVVGSVWRFTVDAEIKQRITNPEWEIAVNSPSQRVRHPPAITVPETILMDWGSVKQGETFSVTRKFLAYNIRDPHTGGYLNTVNTGDTYVPINFRDKDLHVAFSAIEPYIEAESLPDTRVYVIRDRVTAEYYQEWEWTPEAVALQGQGTLHRRAEWTTQAKMTKLFGKAKKFKSLGALKNSMLLMTGYYEGMDLDLEFIGTERRFDFDPNWIAVAFDKFSKEEIETVDIQPWNARLWQIRELSLRYGGPVRKVFDELDKRGRLDDFRHILAVRSTAEDRRELSREELAEAQSIAVGAGWSKSDYLITKSPYGVAIALKSDGAALRFKLGYSGSLRLNVLDIRELKEVVQ